MIYTHIIERGKSRVKTSNDGLHKHRILPGHSGGKYISENISYLTRKEHRLVHYILWKMYGHRGDLCAYIKLGGRNCQAWNKGLRGYQTAWNKGKTTSLKGKTWNDILGEEKANNRRNDLKLKLKGRDHIKLCASAKKAALTRAANGFISPLKGRPISDETKRKLSEKLRGKHRRVSNRDRNRMKGNTNTKGMSWYTNGTINRMFLPENVQEGFVKGKIQRKRIQTY